MKHRFSEVPAANIQRSTFDRSHGLKTTFDGGWLVPIYLDQHILPGDTVKLNLTGFARLSTPTYPLMDNMTMDTFFFFVPYRTIWTNFKKMHGEQVDPGDSIDYTVPQKSFTNVSNQSIYDYFGLPTQVNAAISVSALPFRAYNFIWNEWFRDQNLQNSKDVNTDNGPDATSYNIYKRGKRHDYFTSCLPWLQKGDAVTLSLGSTADFVGLQYQNIAETGSMTDVADGTSGSSAANARGVSIDVTVSGHPKAWVDLAGASASTVNELRQAIQTQRILEKDARSGTRYTEIVESHFSVTSPDARLQRPEYLGGGSSPVIVTPVARTDGSPGELGAYGTAAFKDHGFIKSFTEHGCIIGLVCVRADLTYQEGIERDWSNSTRYDFYLPTLAHLGEQAVLNKEIYVDAATVGVTDEDVFGYQERWAHLRYKPSKITGKFRSNDAGSLDAWHLGVEFGAEPTLDASFIQDDPPIDRVIATPSEPHFIFDSYFNVKHSRPMPVYSVPGLIDHF